MPVANTKLEISGSVHRHNTNLHDAKTNLCLSGLVGTFPRTFSIPSLADEDAITTSLKDGLLIVKIPKKVELKAVGKAKRITIAKGINRRQISVLYTK